MLIRTILPIVVAAAIARTATAQAATPAATEPSWAPPLGTHIRGYVLRPDSTAINGWLVRYDGAFAGIATCARCVDARWIPIDSVLALETQHGEARYRGSRFVGHVAAFTGVGATVGLGLGLIFVATHPCHQSSCELQGLSVPIGAIYGSGVGLLAGVISGLVVEKPVWTPVRQP